MPLYARGSSETRIKAMSKRNSQETAEGFLRIIIDEGFRPPFEKLGYKLPEKIDIDFGFTSHGSRTGPAGEFYDGAATTNGVPKMNIRCDTADIDKILKAVGHQCLHAAVGAGEGHGKRFRDCALRMQYEGSKMREAVPGKDLMERLHALAESLGPFPRGALQFETLDHSGAEKKPKLAADHPEKQKNRQLKCECLLEDCGYIARVSAMNLREKGAPICPIHNTPMWHEELPPETRVRQEARKAPAVEPETALIEHKPVLALEYKPGDDQ
jgi:hypothetical protein